MSCDAQGLSVANDALCVVRQVIIKVSQLLGESVVLDSSHFYESLALINSYANSDKAMTRTSELGGGGDIALSRDVLG